jgi:hypothetical protein
VLQRGLTSSSRDQPVTCLATTWPATGTLPSCWGTSFLTHLQGYHVRATGGYQERGWSMTEQVPEDLTEAEVADRLEAGRSEGEGDGASEVDRWDDEGGHDRAG